MAPPSRALDGDEVTLIKVLGSEQTYEEFQVVRGAALDVMLKAIDRGDYAELAQMYAAWSWDLTLLPSTPAWTGWNPLTSAGRLAVVGDRIVFFSERLWGGPKVTFVMCGKGVEARHAATPWLGAVTMTLREGQARHKVVLTPPRNAVTSR